MRLKNVAAAILAVGVMGGAAAQELFQPKALRKPIGPRYALDRVVVAFKGAVPLGKRLEVVRKLGLSPVPGHHNPHFVQLGFARARTGGADPIPQLLATLRANPLVRFAEPAHYGSISRIPVDERFPDQWALNNTGQDFGQGAPGTPDADIDAAEAWDRHQGSKSIRVAVIDSGVDYNHADLAGQMARDGGGQLIGKDWIEGGPDDGPMDAHGHGTHVAGIIGAEGHNTWGIAGVCWRVSLIPLRTFDQNGDGLQPDSAEAIDFAVANGARVINCSFIFRDFSQAMLEACNRARDAGVLIVCGAGNDKANNDLVPLYPANHRDSGVISVGATKADDAWDSSYSNWGATTVDLFAPGTGILSTYPGNQFAYLDGTSMATPHVSGAAALLLAAEPALTRNELREKLLGFADPLPGLAGRCITGARLNIGAAVGDDFESDDTKPAVIDRQRSKIQLGATQMRSFHRVGDEDWAWFELTEYTELRIAARGVDSPALLNIELHSPTSRIDLSWGTPDPELVYGDGMGLGPGKYYVRIFDFQNNEWLRAYELHVESLGGSGSDLVGSWQLLKAKKSGKKYKMSAQFRVKNQGTVASTACSVGFWASTDTTLDQNEDTGIPVKVGGQWVHLEVPVGALKAGEEVTLGPVKFSVSASSYKSLLKKKYLIGRVDENREVDEADEENNTFVSQRLK